MTEHRWVPVYVPGDFTVGEQACQEQIGRAALLASTSVLRPGRTCCDNCTLETMCQKKKTNDSIMCTICTQKVSTAAWISVVTPNCLNARI